MLLNKLVTLLTKVTPKTVVLYSTLFVLAGSIPLVYLASIIAGVAYSKFLFTISVVLPLILTPAVTILLIRLAENLTFVQDKLQQEIEQNRQKDLILFEQARFVLMGEMMANISHQWKQPLNTINLALLNMKLEKTHIEDNDKIFMIIEENVNYLASTINDFMSFFDKRTHSEIKPLQEIIREIHSVVDAHMENKKIQLKIIADESYGRVKVASSITQVVLNLINNAKDALESVEEKSICVHFLTNSHGLEIECCDTGSGLDEKLKKKIFEPYFTTKDKTQGTGIGLYMSKQIVHKVFDGNIDLSAQKESRSQVYPYDNRGKTCFYIALPYSENCILEEENNDT